MTFDRQGDLASSCHSAVGGKNSACDDSSSRSVLFLRRKRQRNSWSRFAIFASLGMLVSSLNVCDCFSPPACLNRAALRQESILQVVETEAPSGVRRSRTTPQPLFTNRSTFPPVCQQEEGEGSGKESNEDGRMPDSTAESDNDVEYTEEEEEEVEKQSRLSKTAKAAALLARRKGSHPRKSSNKSTSVGERRNGSASRARGGARSMTRLADAVRHSAGASTSNKPSNPRDEEDDRRLSSKISQSTIRSTVNEMIKTSTHSIRLLGEPSAAAVSVNEIVPNPPPGTVLVDCQNNNRWKAADRVSVRVATPSDDLDIANLRLSVFSCFPPSMRQAFCARSCHVLASRRNQGATCIVATVPRYGSILSTRKDIILGTAECSVHEFDGTELGNRRPPNSMLYITEVAVGPTARRKGIGGKIMQSIDEMARIRGIETLYLHVDVSNDPALGLYERAGYAKVPVGNPVYSEFTKSLNLHDGAMKGRNHYLLHKHIDQPTWLAGQNSRSRRGTLGIEITA
eukprot:scaffold1868_cov193-Cylindrotheca_fusiformis.AAC.3